MRESDGRAAVTVQRTAGTEPARDAAGIYREVQGSAAFREVRRRYRRFAFPVTVVFLGWYLAYVLAAIAAPGVMARPVAGALNVAMVAGLAQFATTFLLTWAYARHARLRRDPAAMELRWTVTLETLQGGVRQERLALTAGQAQGPGASSRSLGEIR
ncbi:DUF485 domain-containing protein [Streptomyces sp. NPDC026206]|uniref:DUF485 domain-containing protein n=1 Tax=Streptomyces sp. NPDC026206 TaxID=3157089 RepID=UPI0033CEE051